VLIVLLVDTQTEVDSPIVPTVLLHKRRLFVLHFAPNVMRAYTCPPTKRAHVAN